MRPNSIKKAGNNIINQTPTTIKNHYPQNQPQPKPQKYKQPIPKKSQNVSKPTSSPNYVLIRDNINSTPGNGLWCQQVNKQEEDKPYESIIPKLNTDLLSLDPEKEVDKQLIEKLRFQVSELASKLQDEMAKSYDAQYRATRAENNKQTYLDMVENKCHEISELESQIKSMDNSISSMTEALTNAKKEIMRLTNELKSESEKNKNLSQNIENIMIDKERNNYQNSNDVSNLQKKINSLEIEKENLIKIIQNRNSKEQINEEAQQLQKVINDKEKILTSMEINMTKALNENAELKKRLSNEESNKGKLNEIIKKNKEKIKSLQEQIDGYYEHINNAGNDMKWNQNQIAQKDTQIKVIKDKLKAKDELIVKLNKKIEDLKKEVKVKDDEIINLKNGQGKEDGTLLEEVKAKPFLFGPEKEEEDEDMMFDYN